MREITIKVLVTEDHGGCFLLTDHRSEDGEYTIVMSPNQIKELKTTPIIALGHELCHVLGYEFSLPWHSRVSKISKRIKKAPYLLANALHAKAHTSGAILKQEHEAWDLLEKLFETRERCAESYENVRKGFL